MTAHVLFVDDERPNLLVFEALCSGDFAVLTASSASEAVELMRGKEVGVVLSDQRMPDTSGVELLERIRGEFPDAVRMLVTAHADLSATIDAINRGQVRRYIRKPWDAEELKAAIAESMALYQSRRAIQALEGRLIETERVYGLGVVATSLAHELRGPVGAVLEQIKVARDLLRRALDAPLPEPAGGRSLRAPVAQADEALVDAAVAADRILGLVRAMELPTRPREDGFVDLAHLLRLTMRILRAELRDTGVVDIQLAPVPNVRGSSAKLGQVVINLVVNAIRAVAHRPKGESSIAVRLRAEGDWVCLEVDDNRATVPPPALDHMFDPLFRGEQLAGSGLGLAISKKIAEELGGRMEVSTRSPGRTLFRLVLPAAVGESNG